MIIEEFLKTYAAQLLEGSWLVLGVAFVAGLLSSAVCPFTLPVALGVAGVSGTSEARARGAGLPITMAFFLGLVLSLTGLGAGAGLLGVVATEAFGRYWMGGMACLTLLIALLLVWKPVERMQGESWFLALRRPGLLGAFLYGVGFSFGTPALSLVLLLSLAAAQQQAAYGAALAFAFGLGRGLPILLLGLFGRALSHLTCRSTGSRQAQWATVILLLLLAGYYAWFLQKSF